MPSTMSRRQTSRAPAPPPDAITRAAELTPAQVLAALGSRAEGLTDEEAVALRARHGPNALPDKRRSRWRLLLRQFDDPMVIVLIVALFLSVLAPMLEAGSVGLEEAFDGVVIGAILVLNALLGFVQESRADDAIRALQRLSAPKARVLRAGRERQVAAVELVPGDVIRVEPGDGVPADARLLWEHELEVDESTLTGESVPVAKDPAPAVADTPAAEQHGMLFAGTMVTRGSAGAVVTATGLHARTGRIAHLMGQAEVPPTPLELRLRGLGRTLGLVALAACVGVAAVGVWRGLPPVEILMIGVSLAVSAIPEGLPAIVTVCFAVGVRRMVAHNAIVRRLDALETLGSVTVICTDKTGTITRNRMTVVEHWLADAQGDPAELAVVMASCNTAQLPNLGDPTELALLAWAQTLEASRLPIDEELQPFSSELRSMRTRHGALVFVKGGVERVLGLCGLEGEQGAAALAASREIASRGRRVLAAARDSGDGLRLVGLVGLEDPPRDGVVEAVATARRAGIRSVMITGDQLATAQAIGRAVGIEGDAMTGRELARLDDAGLKEAVGRVAVFARISPEQKLAICGALIDQGQVVAMSGDGVNDAPALKRAHVGVAMGERGSDVARQAASIVLADDHFATIVGAVREGRRIHDNIRKFVVYLLCANFDEMLLILTAMLLDLPLPLLPLHILWINLLTDGLPALALSAEAAEPDIMDQPPRPPGQHILAGEAPRLVLATVLGFASAFSVFWWLHEAGAPLDEQRTSVLTVIVLFEIFLAWSSRSRRPIWRASLLGNRWMVAASATVLLLQVLLLVTPLAGLMHLAPLSVARWGQLAGVAAAAIVLFEVGKVVLLRMHRR